MAAQATEVSDDALVIAVARRRHEALAELYERHGAAMHEVAERICGASCADELVRQVFLDLWHEPENFDVSHESLRTSLVMRTHRLAVDDRRAHALPGERAPTAAISSDRAWPLLSQLPSAEHTAIWLTYFVGYTAAEVARLLDQSEAKIKRRLGSGLRELQALSALTDEGVVPMT